MAVGLYGGLSCFTLSRGMYNNGLNAMQQNASGDCTECKPLPKMVSTGNSSIGGTIKQITKCYI